MGAHAARIARAAGRLPEPDRADALLARGQRQLTARDGADAAPCLRTGRLLRLLRRGVHLVFKAGPFGFPSIAAHAHCDQLSVLLKRGVQNLLADAGTGVYHTDERWRRYFKGVSAHNTIAVDGHDQAEYAGAFLWATHANGHLRLVTDEPDRFEARGSHDGYRRLSDPVGHERILAYQRGIGYRVVDRLLAECRHSYDLHWNFDRAVVLRPLGEDVRDCAWRVFVGETPVLVLVIRSDVTLRPRIRSGDESKPAGFCSGPYREWYPAPRLDVSFDGAACGVTTWLLTGADTGEREMQGLVDGWS